MSSFRITPLTIHKTEGNTITGLHWNRHKGDMMILLQSCLLNLFLEIGIVPFVQNGDASFRCYAAEFITGQHFSNSCRRWKSRSYRCKLPVSCHSSLFGGDFYHTGCTSRTVLCGFGSVFQDGKTLNVRRVNGGKHTQVAKYSVDDNQRGRCRWSVR